MAREFDQLESMVTPPSLNGPQRRRVVPADPMVDTFRQRYAPFSSDPAGDYIEEREKIPARVIQPGTGERFGDPTKVISDASPDSVRAGQQSAQLPPGFKFTDEPPAQAPTELPKGFKWLDTPAPTAPAAAMAGAGLDAVRAQTLPEDPAERAAMTMQRAVQPPGGRQEGGISRAIDAVVPAIGREVNRVGEIAKEGITTGDLPPDKAMEMSLLATGASPAYHTGRGVARAALRPQQAEQLETGVTAIPRAAEAGPAMQAVGRTLAGLPIGGSRLRKAAEESTSQLKAAGEAASSKPLGFEEAVPQQVAGEVVRRSLQAKPIEDLKYLLNKSDEDMIGEVLRMAGSKNGADVRTLIQLRKAVPEEGQSLVQSALIDRLGKGTTGEFDPKTWLKNYGSMPERSKGFLFGTESSSLRYHLDSIESMSKIAPTWQQFEKGRSPLATRIGLGTMVGAALGTGASLAPLSVLGVVVPIAVVVRGLSSPVTAAPIAQWSRAWAKFTRSGGAPQSIATLKMATDNLKNNLGVDISIDDFVKGTE